MKVPGLLFPSASSHDQRVPSLVRYNGSKRVKPAEGEERHEEMLRRKDCFSTAESSSSSSTVRSVFLGSHSCSLVSEGKNLEGIQDSSDQISTIEAWEKNGEKL